MADVMYVKGEGGVVWEMTPPLSEGIAGRLAKGHLKRVNADGSPYREPEDVGSDLTDGTPAKPSERASKAEWVGFAVNALGMEADDAEAATKQDLIDLAGQ